MNRSLHTALRAIPSVESVLRDAAHDELLGKLPQPLATGVVREVLDAVRAEVRLTGSAPDPGAIRRRVARALALYVAGRPARVVNATGVVLHTNLGRAVLGERIGRRLAEVAHGYSDLELDVATGERGRREAQTELMLKAATGAEAAIVVNNCAAAMLLLLDTFAHGREVIVSRGELVEIGGSFRIPDVLEKSGAKMVEVGTTNKTKLVDYRSAVTESTAVLLKVHTSNFRIQGFTEATTTAELAALASESDLLVIRDLGSGVLGFSEETAPEGEPSLAGELRSGAHLVAASGDKLLGGPQAGIIVGRTDLVARAAKNPMYRALRPDKLTIAALSEALTAHLEGNATRDLPALAMWAANAETLHAAAEELASRIAHRAGKDAVVEVVSGASQMGGGTLPGVELPTSLVAVEPRHHPAHRVEARLRASHPPVLVRVQDDRVMLDPRTLVGDEIDLVATRLSEVIARGETKPNGGTRS